MYLSTSSSPKLWVARPAISETSCTTDLRVKVRLKAGVKEGVKVRVKAGVKVRVGMSYVLTFETYP